MKSRRRFITDFVIALMPLGATASAQEYKAQQADKIARIGWLALNLAAGDPFRQQAFLQGMRDLGYVERRNLLIEYRDAEGKPERFPLLAAELASLNVDVILTTGGSLAAVAAKRATTTLPIVFAAVGDPVGEGLVSSLARPGGNVTGLSVVATELVGKSLELLTQAVPGVSRVAILLKPDAMPDHTRNERLEAAERAARALGVQLQVVEARSPEDFDRAFSDMKRARVGALYVHATPVFENERRRLANLAAKNRLPTVYAFKGWVDDGGLMSYGPDIAHLSRRVAVYVDKILKGAKYIGS